MTGTEYNVCLDNGFCYPWILHGDASFKIYVPWILHGWKSPSRFTWRWILHGGRVDLNQKIPVVRFTHFGICFFPGSSVKQVFRRPGEKTNPRCCRNEDFLICRGDKIWTCDPTPPRRVRYQTAPHPELIVCSGVQIAPFSQNGYKNRTFSINHQKWTSIFCLGAALEAWWDWYQFYLSVVQYYRSLQFFSMDFLVYFCIRKNKTLQYVQIS